MGGDDVQSVGSLVCLILRPRFADRGADPHLVAAIGGSGPVHIRAIGCTTSSEIHIVIGQLDAIATRSGLEIDLGVGLISAPREDIAVILGCGGTVCVE